MKRYIVSYIDDSADELTHFLCSADDADHAVEQLQDAYPRLNPIDIFEVCELVARDWNRNI